MKLKVTKPEAGRPTERRWPGYLLKGRIRTSTVVLILAFAAVWWVHDTYQAEVTPPPAPQVVPPGFIPDPAYTWVPRTRLQQPPVTVTETITPTPTTTEPPPPEEQEPPGPVPGFPFCPPLCPPPPPPPPEHPEQGPPSPQPPAEPDVPGTHPGAQPGSPAPAQPSPVMPAAPPGPATSHPAAP